jgi:antitoxin HicB
MNRNGIEYPFEIRPLSRDEGGGYAITYPDLPGCRSDGETPEEAIRNGRAALRDWLAVAREFGDEVPAPYSSASGRFLLRVPRSLHQRLIDEAVHDRVSLNTMVVSLVAEGLGRRAGRPGGSAGGAGRRLTRAGTSSGAPARRARVTPP